MPSEPGIPEHDHEVDQHPDQHDLAVQQQAAVLRDQQAEKRGEKQDVLGVAHADQKR